VTLTVKNGDDLAERFKHLHGANGSYGNAANAVAALCSMVLWVLCGPTK
jgi:hypothetical protein